MCTCLLKSLTHLDVSTLKALSQPVCLTQGRGLCFHSLLWEFVCSHLGPRGRAWWSLSKIHIFLVSPIEILSLEVSLIQPYTPNRNLSLGVMLGGEGFAKVLDLSKMFGFENFLKKINFYLKADLQRGKERQTNLPSASWFPKWPRWLVLGRSNTRNFFWSPTRGCRGSRTWAIFCYFPKHISRQLGSETVRIQTVTPMEHWTSCHTFPIHSTVQSFKCFQPKSSFSLN